MPVRSKVKVREVTSRSKPNSAAIPFRRLKIVTNIYNVLVIFSVIKFKHLKIKEFFMWHAYCFVFDRNS